MSTMGLVSTLSTAVNAAILNLDFENADYSLRGQQNPLDALVYCQRSTGASRVKGDGGIEFLAADTLRIQHDRVTGVRKGLLVEESKTNILRSSINIQFGAWSSTNAIKATSPYPAPDGTMNGCDVVENEVTGQHEHLQGTSAQVVGTAYSVSGYLKKRAHKYGYLSNYSDSFCTVVVDLDTGAVVRTIGVAPDLVVVERGADGWWFVAITRTATGTSSVFCCYGGTPDPQAALINGRPSYAGVPGRAAVAGWGFQVEASARATSLIASPVTFNSRSTGAMMTDFTGTLVPVEVNVPRDKSYAFSEGKLYPVGLLVEEGSTNLAIHSNSRSTLSPTRTSYIESNVWFPDRSGTLRKLIEDTSADITHYALPALVAIEPGYTYTFSYFLKAAERSKVNFNFQNEGSWGGASQVQVDLAAKTVTTTGTAVGALTEMSDGIFRLSLTRATTAQAAFSSNLYPVLVSATGTTTYTGDGVSGIFIGGYQVERRATMTSYIPTPSTFVSRAGKASYTDIEGLLQTAEAGVARDQHYRYDALTRRMRKTDLLTEAAATNLLLWSEDFSSSRWAAGGTGGSALAITRGASSGPRGPLTMTSVKRVDASNRYINTFVSGTVAGGQGALSVVAKAGNSPGAFLCLRMQCTYPARIDAWFNLLTGECGVNSLGDAKAGRVSMTPQAGGVWKCAVMGLSGAAAFNQLFIGASDNTVQVDTTSSVPCEVFVDCAQFEVGPSDTSYIATAGAAATRPADVITSATASRTNEITTSSAATRAVDLPVIRNSADWLPKDSGSITGEFSPGPIGVGATNLLFYFRSATDAARSVLAGRRGPGTNVAEFIAIGADATVLPRVTITNAAIASAGRLRLAMGYDAKGLAGSTQGLPAQTAGAITVPSPDFACIGQNGGGSQCANGLIHRISVFGVKMPAAQLPIITA